jgi:Tol biopolymer transport system component
LTWLDRSGHTVGHVGEGAQYMTVALSPDERRIAVTMNAGSMLAPDIWTVDLTRGVPSRFTFDPAAESNPIWSPDGSQILFQSGRAPDFGLHAKRASGAGDEELVLKGRSAQVLPSPNDWSPDGQVIAYQTPTVLNQTGVDIWMLPMAGDRKPFPFVQGPASDFAAAFSPDGRWVAYVSDESGAPQVYVRPFPPSAGVFQISKSGGTQPQWRGDGKELYFVISGGANTMMAATIDTSREFQAGLPQVLFEGGFIANPGGRHQYAVTKDGRRFLVLVPQTSDSMAGPQPLTVVTNWLAAVQK